MGNETMDRFVFVDIETTGLDPKADFILEVGLKVTDERLNILGEWSSLIFNEDWRARIAGNNYVYQMHQKSGLIFDMDEALNDPRAHHELSPALVAYAGAYNWLTNTMGLAENAIPMAGNSVQFDREFLREHMPVLHAFFTYRNTDISTLKELSRRFNPELAAAVASRFKKEDAVHRVLPDIDSSIAELRFYMDEFLFVPGNAIDGTYEQIPGQEPLPGLGELSPNCA